MEAQASAAEPPLRVILADPVTYFSLWNLFVSFFYNAAQSAFISVSLVLG
jgi:hypothetical protein